MNANGLKFFVIGAMKSGTTSLHFYLRKHPEVLLPVEKEVPFFAFDELYNKGMDWYLREFFPRAKESQLLGTVSPQYMLDKRVPERMYSHCPDAKLIALLRDPLDRARSHYKMMVRAFGEKRSFEEAVDGQYARCGEYGSYLSDYLRYFPRDHLLVVYSKDLDIDPAAVTAKIFRFLGLPPERASLPDKRHNVASGARSHPILRTAANVIHYHSGPLKPLLRRLMPRRYSRRLGKWSILYRSGMDVREEIDVSLSQDKERELATRFLNDADTLEQVVGRPVPWRGRLERLLNDGIERERASQSGEKSG